MNHATATKHQHIHKIADELKHFLADTYALYIKTQNFHWNVEGPHFFSLHKMFEEQYQELAGAVDEIAERIRSLGVIAPGSLSQFMQLTSIKDEKGSLSADKMVSHLMKDHEALSQSALQMIVKAQKAHDEGTVDLLIERSKVHDKAAWMLRCTIAK